MIVFYYPDTLHSANRYKEAKKEAEKRSRKEKNDKNRQKQGQNGLFRVAFKQNRLDDEFCIPL